MHRDLRQRARLRRVDEIFRLFLAATRAKLKLGDNELLQRAEQSAQTEPGEPVAHSKDDAS